MRIPVFIFLPMFLCAMTTYAQSDTKKNEVMMKMQSLRNALLAKDSVSLSALLANDVTYGHSTGMIQTKAQLIRSVMSGEQDYRSIEPSDLNVRVYDAAAIATVKLRVNVAMNGKAMDLNMTATFTWVKINGDWKLVARQSARLPD